MNSESPSLFEPLVFSTPLAGILRVYFGGVQFLGSFWIRVVFPLVIHLGISVGIYSFRLPVCRGWRWIFRTKIRVFVSKSRYISTWEPFSSICNSFSKLFIHSVFVLCSFCFHILLHFFNLFIPLYLLIFAHPSLLVGIILFYSFGTIYFVDSVCSCLSIFLVFLL